ncbi:MAG TPA: class I SAM-dependent methyltransferase [Deltaproteobacteria bacterium]|jgi:alpha-N-acetylglucosaminidase|nr:class I SAM-dependent methyltransferase [Deltaproteobacteria bacterium]HQI01368.1 class I SAM-dependent methyltransferase [Deltaproteobacteria bacterium]HQJ09929.1 class I SAM-dependent methyltransferase [Deltaproteobacteria bacterium]
MRNYLYKLIIDDVTDICYKNCLDYFPPESKILDVGIGNGIMIRQYHDIIKSKGLQITGIDINRDYLKHCKSLIRQWELSDQIEVHYSPVESYAPPEDAYFDYILFSMSFMLFENQQLVLDRIKPWLKPHGKVVFFQTMFKDKSHLLEVIKPKLKYVTTIDFGRVTYDRDFYDLLDRSEISVTEDRMLKKEWFKGEYRLIISTPRNGNGKRHMTF